MTGDSKKNQKEHKFTKTVSVKLHSVEQVKAFVNDMKQIEGDVLLLAGKYVIDAKSIMGIFSLNLSGPLQLEIEDWKEAYGPIVEKYLHS
ncbi:MAG: HPr family phosphocarrier protein [Lachnospiraceae bacterium]|nr:HPr family phosphocarrier protein [Lachnospiraceae bacterium]